MSKMSVARPVWRRFEARFLDRAVAWVRAGGSAALVHPKPPSARATTEPRVDMILGTDGDGAITDPGYWSILALEQRRWTRIPSGKGKGLARARVQPHSLEAVLDWCERDSVHPGPTRTMRLDCLECGACCHDSNVILYEEDLDRFRKGGRADLTKAPYVERRGGKLRLKFVGKGPCQHLNTRDLKCRIYPIRPFNCSVFPVASEACLAARESTRGFRDGAPSLS
jgi:hypothetical protein